MDYDLVIIGSGPAGYVAAIRAGQVGLKTAVIEKSKIGGMCLNWGCIPTKVLLENAKKLVAVKNAAAFGIDGIEKNKLTFNWKTAINRSNRIVKRLSKGVEYLLKKNGVEIITGEAEIVSQHSVSVENRLLETKNIIIATGSRPETPDYSVPEGTIIEIEDLLNLESLPRRPLVLGNGPHAVELAQFFKMIDKDVKLLVPGDSFLPGLDPYLKDYIKKHFKKSKIDILFFSKLEGKTGGNLVVDGNEIQCDQLINASWRRAVIPPSRIEFSLEKDFGFIKVNDFLQTNVETIYAVGDVNGKRSLAHAASAQGLHAVNVISGIKEKINMDGIPMNMYTYPEIAQVGYTEPEIKAQGLDYKISEFPLSANGKALAEGQTEGLVRIISEKKYGEVMGVQIIAEHATDMIAEAASVIQLEGTVFDVAHTIHAHPTVSEIFMEAGYAAFDQPIHK
jgi:dihydrolipoamide dehydrogenase